MRSWLILLGLYCALLLVSPLFAPADPLKTQPERQFEPPGVDYVLGSDSLGRDVFSRLLHGGRNTVSTAAIASFVAAAPGIMLGTLAGIFPGRTDTLLTSLLDALLAVPGLVLALVVLAVLGRGVLPIALAVGLSQIAPYASVTRAAVIAARSAQFVEASSALGARRTHIIREHIASAIRPVILAYAGVTFSYAILNGAALSFLGLGTPAVPDWGVMLAEGRDALRIAPWISLAPGAAITLLVGLVNRAAQDLATLELRRR